MSIRFEKHIDLGKLKTSIRKATPEALAAGMEHIRAIAAPRTPIETGRLVGSASVHIDAARKRAGLTYTGPYARYQEYVLHLRHQTGQALYLTTSISDGAGDAIKTMGKHLGDAL